MNSFTKGLIYFLAGLAFVLSAVFLSSLINNDGEPQEVIIKEPEKIYVTEPRAVVTCPADYLSYQKLAENPEHVVSLIAERKPMYAENRGFVNSEVIITKNETQESRVACGYLFVQAGTLTNGSLQSWENVYINPDGFGGHINSENHIGRGDSAEFSEYLFPLSKIRYWKSLKERARNSLSTADWGVLFNVTNEVEFNIALNTEDKTGFIDKLSIAYKCWNPKTGEENNDCKLNILQEEDTYN